MKRQERIFWDTTSYPIEYPEEIRKIYFKVSLTNRKFFTKWIGNISKNFNNDIDWWITLPLSRNPYLSNLFHYTCILKTLKNLSYNKRNLLLKVDSGSLLDVIEVWSRKNNLTINIYYKKKTKKIKDYFIILKSIIFYFFLFFYIKYLTKKTEINNNLNKIVLIDTFADTFSLNSSNQNERLYKGLDKFLKKKKLNYVYFVPTFVIDRNIFNIIKIVKAMQERKYLFKEHYLKFKDILFASFHFLRVKKYRKKYVLYDNWNLSKIISEEINSSKDYSSKIVGILNYRFAKNLSDKKIPIKKTINRFENQMVDKGWNLGFRRYFKKIKTYGYQGFLHFPHFMHSIPTKYEEQAKVIPSEIITVGKIYKKPKKEFFPKLKVNVGPALNFPDIFKINKKNKKIGVLIILTGIRSLDLKLLEWIGKVEEINKNIKITLKPHPILAIDKINFEGSFSKNLIISDEKLSSLLAKTSIAVCSGPTSATIESLAYNCFLIVPAIDAFDELNLKILNISKKNYYLVYSREELAEKIKKINMQYILKNKKRNILINKKLFFEKKTKKNLQYFY